MKAARASPSRCLIGHDPSWNVIVRTNNGAPTSFTVNSRNELTNGPEAVCTWDANGNLLSSQGGNWNYTWDAENRLSSVTFTATTRSEFLYDGRSRLRVRKNFGWTGSSWYPDGEVRYVYDGMRVVQERNGSNVPEVSYTRGLDLSGSFEGAGGIGGLLARSHGYSGGNWSTHSYYHADGNGNVTMLLNASQTAVATYRYDPFGRTLTSSGSLAMANTLRFSSKPIHHASGLYDYGYRWYSPNLQRWISRDPIGEEGGRNLYTLVLNDPVGGVDSLGLFPSYKDCLPCEVKRLNRMHWQTQQVVTSIRFMGCVASRLFNKTQPGSSIAVANLLQCLRDNAMKPAAYQIHCMETPGKGHSVGACASGRDSTVKIYRVNFWSKGCLSQQYMLAHEYLHLSNCGGLTHPVARQPGEAPIFDAVEDCYDEIRGIR